MWLNLQILLVFHFIQFINLLRVMESWRIKIPVESASDVVQENFQYFSNNIIVDYNINNVS